MQQDHVAACSHGTEALSTILPTVVGEALTVAGSVALVWIAAKLLRTSHRDVEAWMQTLPPRPSGEGDARERAILEVAHLLRLRTTWPAGLVCAGVLFLFLEGLWIAFGVGPASLRCG